jgi:hypothetical protein
VTDATPSAQRALSRHTIGGSGQFAVEGRHLNAHCRVPGSPFSAGLLLVPNGPDSPPPVVTFGPINAAGFDALTCLFATSSQPEQAAPLTLTVAVLSGESKPLAESELVVSVGKRAALTLCFPPRQDGFCLRVQVSTDGPVNGRGLGGVALHYLVAYRDNELIRLFNAAGSDKGSETYWGDGFPHLYALAYRALFAPLRSERFNFLEIGMGTDAPSLRAWRDFLPSAILYGYDINDFSFFSQRDTHMFQGDQSSRTDIGRFLEAAGMPEFRIIIDDGSHASSHQQISLAALFEQLEPSGVYIIEDLDWQPYAEVPTTRDMLRTFIEQGRIESPFVSEDEARRLESSIGSVDIYRPNDFEFAAITKRAARHQLTGCWGALPPSGVAWQDGA